MNPEMFKEVYGRISNGTERWNKLHAPAGELYEWDDSSYIHNPPFFASM